MSDRDADSNDDSARENEARRRWFREEILPLEPDLRAYAQRFAAHGGGEVDDLVHEVFTRIIAASNWREVRSPIAFSMRILRNLAFDELRRRKVVAIDAVANMEMLNVLDERPDPEIAVASRQELQELHSLITNLPPMCRRVFTLRKVYDLSLVDIAARLSISVSTVEKHLVKGLHICAEKLGRNKRPAARKVVSWRKKNTT